MFNVEMLVFKKEGRALRWRGRGTWLSGEFVGASVSFLGVRA